MYKPFEAFHVTDRFISVIGSGGKTTLLRRLAQRLPGTVILTTSTHMFPFPDLPLVETGREDRRRIQTALERRRVICLGQRQPSGKLSDPSAAA